MLLAHENNAVPTAAYSRDSIPLHPQHFQDSHLTYPITWTTTLHTKKITNVAAGNNLKNISCTYEKQKNYGQRIILNKLIIKSQ
jgi:hypothetical protein